MTLAKYLHLFKNTKKACNLKSPPFHQNELKNKIKQQKQSKNIWNHLFLLEENNNRYIRFQDK